jgi:hypothetical protein
MSYIAGCVGSYDNSCAYSNVEIPEELKFKRMYPHKTVYEFVHTLEDGIFAMCVKIGGLFHLNKWWYPVCHCGEFLDISDGSYYCNKCHLCVFSSASKYKNYLLFYMGTILYFTYLFCICIFKYVL